MLARARQGVGFFRTVFYLPALAPPVAATLGFVYLLNPATGPVNSVPRQARDPGAALVRLAAVGEAVAGAARPVGHRQHDDHLPGRPARRAASTCTSRPRSTAPDAWQRLRYVTLPTISPVILFAVVIGVIEALQYFTQAYVASTIAAGGASAAESANNLGYPEDSTLFYPVLLYQQGFRFFNMGYASAMAMLLLVVSFAVTLVIIRNSRRFVHYSGAALMSDRRRARSRRRSSGASRPAAVRRRSAARRGRRPLRC